MNKIKRTKFNVSLLGETQVGKTSLANVKSGFNYNPSQLATVGIDNFLDKQIFNGIEYKFKIFDTAGQERYNNIVASTIKVADGYVLVFSVDQKSSLDKISTWLKYLGENVDLKEKGLILIGNKIDLPEREVRTEEGKNFAKSFNIKYFETSAKEGIGIDEAFKQIYKIIYELNENIRVEDDNNNSGEIQKDKDKDNKNENIELNKIKHVKDNKKKKKKHCSC